VIRRGSNPELVLPLREESFPSSPQEGRIAAVEVVNGDAGDDVTWLVRYHEYTPFDKAWDCLGSPIVVQTPNIAPLNSPYDEYQPIDDIGFIGKAPFAGYYTLMYSIDIENTDVVAHDYKVGIAADAGLPAFTPPGDQTEIHCRVEAGKTKTVSTLAWMQFNEPTVFVPVAVSLDDVVANVGRYRGALFLQRATVA